MTNTDPHSRPGLEGGLVPWLIVDRFLADANGETHFVRVRIPQEIGDIQGRGALPIRPRSIKMASDRIQIRHLPAGTDMQSHAPERQFVVVLSGRVEVTVSDGEIRSWGPGQIFLATDDGAGRGHRTRIIDGPGVFLLVPLPDGFNVDDWAVEPP